jgi:hypothetical protein
VRRSIAIGAGVIVLILLVLGVRGCLNARQERAFKDYVSDVQGLIGESNDLGKQMFELLEDPGNAGEVDITNAFNQYRNANAQLVERLSAVDHPDELDSAQNYLIETFEFRREGVDGIANALPQALAPQDRRTSTEDIARDMQDFLTSDVIYLNRFVRSLEAELKEQELEGERIPESQFLPSVDWLETSVVADRISSIQGAGGGGDVAPGLHGNGLGTVTLGGQTLTPGGTATITLSDDLAFEVQVSNQGENTETDVQVTVTVGSGGDAIELEETLPEIAAGETQTVTLPLAERPPSGESVPITVEVVPVPGEEKTDNNSGEFSAIFTQ